MRTDDDSGTGLRLLQWQLDRAALLRKPIGDMPTNTRVRNILDRAGIEDGAKLLALDVRRTRLPFAGPVRNREIEELQRWLRGKIAELERFAKQDNEFPPPGD